MLRCAMLLWLLLGMLQKTQSIFDNSNLRWKHSDRKLNGFMILLNSNHSCQVETSNQKDVLRLMLRIRQSLSKYKLRMIWQTKRSSIFPRAENITAGEHHDWIFNRSYGNIYFQRTSPKFMWRLNSYIFRSVFQFYHTGWFYIPQPSNPWM